MTKHKNGNGKGKGKGMSRRGFLKASSGVVVGLAAANAAGGLGALNVDPGFAARSLVPIGNNGNPLESYPNRGWEQVYHDQYSYDRSFTRKAAFCRLPSPYGMVLVTNVTAKRHTHRGDGTT